MPGPGESPPAKGGNWDESYIVDLFDWHLLTAYGTPDRSSVLTLANGRARILFEPFPSGCCN